VTDTEVIIMRKTMLAITLTALSLPASAVDEEFYGTYALISSTRTILTTGQVDAFTQERGFITYGKDGRMLVLIVRGERPKAESLEKMTDQQRADSFRSMTAYGGTYTFDGKRMEHHIDISWNEVLTGSTLFRDVKKEGNRLIYTTHPAPNASNGKMSVTTLVWEKVK
jgi:hypothetical protein